MEEAKAAAYYEELTRKGEGAARFKQGLGFSSSSNSSSKPPPGSSFLSSFVRSGQTRENPESSDLTKEKEKEREREREREREKERSSETERRAQLSSVRNKLSRDKHREDSSGRERDKDRDRDRYRDRDRERERKRDRYGDRERNGDRNGDGYGDRDRERNKDRDRERNRRSRSPERNKDRNKKVDYAEIIPGYDRMTPAERVKAKLKLQLSQTAAKDTNKGKGEGWERFDFDKNAPLDDYDDEIEGADDDAKLMKDIGKSFRLSAVEAKREDEIRKAHDEAMFGSSNSSNLHSPKSNHINITNENVEDKQDGDILPDEKSSLVNDKVLEMRQGSWKDRARKLRDNAK